MSGQLPKIEREQDKTMADSSHRFIDLRMHDGSRHFADLPEHHDAKSGQWQQIRDHVEHLQGSANPSLLTDGLTEAWISFDLGEHRFSLNNQMNRWWLFVDPPECDDRLLAMVFDHFEHVLAPHSSQARLKGAIALGSYRAVVYEAHGAITHRDFADLDTALGYADDCASEAEDGPVSAYVVDADFALIRSGRHY